MATTSAMPPAKNFAGILKEPTEYGTGRGSDASDRLNTWFDTLMLQSGTGMAPAAMLLLCVVAAVTAGGVLFVIQENFLTTALAALVGFILPVIALVMIRSNRQMTMLKQVPPMLEELARAAKTGRSVEQSFRVVVEDTPAPLGEELRLAAGRLDLGMSLADALRDLPARTGLMTLNLLVSTLTVQQQTGGDLVRVLERLSRTVRDRLSFLGRLRAATAASRATAILMIVLPPAILAFFTLRDPNYLTALFSSSWGRNATLTAFALEAIGAIWVLRILDDSSKS